MNYYVIPEIAGRLLVGGDPSLDLLRRPEITFFMDVSPIPGMMAAPDNYYLDNAESVDDLERRVAALKWFWEKSQMVGSVFYLFSPPRAWEMAAMCLMARWGWTKKHAKEIIETLESLMAGDFVDFDIAEKAYQAWLERGTAQR